jgi:hypothetical protein
VNSAPLASRVLAEVPITTSEGSTIIRIVAPAEATSAPRIRTRATP